MSSTFMVLYGPTPRATTPTIFLTALSVLVFLPVPPPPLLLFHCSAPPEHPPCLPPPPSLTLFPIPPLGAAMEEEPLFALVPIIPRGTFKPGSTTHQLGAVIPPANLLLAGIVHSFPTIGGVWSQTKSKQLCSSSWTLTIATLPEASGAKDLELTVLARTVHSCPTIGGFWSQAMSNNSSLPHLALITATLV